MIEDLPNNEQKERKEKAAFCRENFAVDEKVIAMKITPSRYARQQAQKDADKYGQWSNVDGAALIPNENPHRKADWQIALFSDAAGDLPDNAIEVFRPKKAFLQLDFVNLLDGAND